MHYTYWSFQSLNFANPRSCLQRGAATFASAKVKNAIGRIGIFFHKGIHTIFYGRRIPTRVLLSCQKKKIKIKTSLPNSIGGKTLRLRQTYEPRAKED